MRGRPSKPIEQKAREGNAGHRPLPEPVKFKGGPPTRPPDLPDAAALLWDEVVPVLHDAGVADKVDSTALTALCVQWARAEQARQVLARQGMFAHGSMGQLVEHPALAIEARAHTLVLRFAEQYGLTAAARVRIAAAANIASQAREEQELHEIIDMKPVPLETAPT